MSAETTQFEISNPATDGISCVKWLHHSNHLAATSWDKSVCLYKINVEENKEETNELISRYCHDAGVLDCAVSSDDATIFSVGCDNRLHTFDVLSSKHRNYEIGHTEPIRCVSWDNSTQQILTGSWDKSLKMWDMKSKTAAISLALPDKVFAMSLSPPLHRVVVGIAGRQVWVYDLRNLSEPTQKRESSLKHQTRNIVCHPNGEQYVVSSIEGRVAVEYFDAKSDIQSQKYAFKCHRVTDKSTGMQTIYPVNAITFHPKHCTFATGGGDGVVNIWDGSNKKRICQFPPYNTSVASLDFNRNGSLIAIASSYTWEHGATQRPADAIWIRKVKEAEAKPKVKKII